MKVPIVEVWKHMMGDWRLMVSMVVLSLMFSVGVTLVLILYRGR